MSASASDIRVPTLVMHHTGDRDVKLEEGRFLAEHIPGRALSNCQAWIMPGGRRDRDMIIDEIEELLTGIKPAREADRVLATVLFTDIVGATQAVVDQGDRRWLELLKQHHALVRKELARFPRTRSQYRSAIRLLRLSTDRRAQFVAPAIFATLSLSSGSKSVLDCTPEKSNCR